MAPSCMFFESMAVIISPSSRRLGPMFGPLFSEVPESWYLRQRPGKDGNVLDPCLLRNDHAGRATRFRF